MLASRHALQRRTQHAHRTRTCSPGSGTSKTSHHLRDGRSAQGSGGSPLCSVHRRAPHAVVEPVAPARRSPPLGRPPASLVGPSGRDRDLHEQGIDSSVNARISRTVGVTAQVGAPWASTNAILYASRSASSTPSNGTARPLHQRAADRRHRRACPPPPSSPAAARGPRRSRHRCSPSGLAGQGTARPGRAGHGATAPAPAGLRAATTAQGRGHVGVVQCRSLELGKQRDHARHLGCVGRE
jgi:hypothetical protein